MKKSLSKITILVISILLLITLVGCKKPNSNEDDTPPPITYPTEIVKAKADEVIFVTLNSDGIISSMNASNHITDAEFKNYQQFGHFNPTGHLNVTSSKAKISLKEDHALIPSLNNYENFFYMLGLDKDHYKNSLPFIITTSTKLDNNEVSSKELSGSSGNIKLSYKFEPNPQANLYYLKNFAAQVQIPINLTNSKIISSPNTMSEVLVGQTLTLAYMVMPGQSLTIEIELEASNFKFDGMQAVLMKFDLLEMAKDMINLNEMGLDQFPQMTDGITNIITEFTNAKNQMEPFFQGLSSLSQLNESFDLTMFSQLQLLIDGINEDELHMGYTSLLNSQIYGFGQGDKLAQFVNPVKETRQSTSQLTTKYKMLEKAIQTLSIAKTKIEPLITKYPQAFTKLNDIILSLESMKAIVSNLSLVDFKDLNILIENKDNISIQLSNLDTLLESVKIDFQTLITSMYPLAEELGQIVMAINGVMLSINDFYLELTTLIVKITDLAALINNGLNENWFSILARTGITKLRDGLTNVYSSAEEPGLVEQLTLAKTGIEQYDLSQVQTMIQPLLNMFIPDENNKRQIDEFHLGFIQMNQGLALKQEGAPASFYDSINMIVSLRDILNLLPPKLEGELPSFLSDKNESPNSLQFIIKYSGF